MHEEGLEEYSLHMLTTMVSVPLWTELAMLPQSVLDRPHSLLCQASLLKTDSTAAQGNQWYLDVCIGHSKLAHHMPMPHLQYSSPRPHACIGARSTLLIGC